MAEHAAAAHPDFDAFVAEATPTLLRTAYLMAGDLAEAEDAVQETLFRVARRWQRVRSMQWPLAYARRTLINVMLDGAARRSRRQAELAEWASDDGGATHGDQAAEQALQAVDARFDVAAALAALPPRQRAVVVLRGSPLAPRQTADADRKRSRRQPRRSRRPEASSASSMAAASMSMSGRRPSRPARSACRWVPTAGTSS